MACRSRTSRTPSIADSKKLECFTTGPPINSWRKPLDLVCPPPLLRTDRADAEDSATTTFDCCAERVGSIQVGVSTAKPRHYSRTQDTEEASKRHERGDDPSNPSNAVRPPFLLRAVTDEERLRSGTADFLQQQMMTLARLQADQAQRQRLGSLQRHSNPSRGSGTRGRGGATSRRSAGRGLATIPDSY